MAGRTTWSRSGRSPAAPICAGCCRRRDGATSPRFARAIGMRRVDFPAAKWDPFLNVNTPEDLALARAIAEGKT